MAQDNCTSWKYFDRQMPICGKKYFPFLKLSLQNKHMMTSRQENWVIGGLFNWIARSHEARQLSNLLQQIMVFSALTYFSNIADK
jgi:hypothetical protein